MPLFDPPATGGISDSAVGFYGVTPVARPTGYTSSYPTMTRTMGSYTSDPKGSAYTGGLLDLLQAARLSDLNSVRVALENLRVFSENVAQDHNQLIADLKLCGLIG